MNENESKKTQFDLELDAAVADGVNPHIITLMLFLVSNDRFLSEAIEKYGKMSMEYGGEGKRLMDDLLFEIKNMHELVDKYTEQELKKLSDRITALEQR